MLKNAGMLLLAVGILTIRGTAISDYLAMKASLEVKPQYRECALSVQGDTVLEFCAEDLESRLNLPQGGLGGFTVTGLPLPDQGALVLEGVEVDLYDFVGRDQIDQLCFVPNETADAAVFTLLPQGIDAVPASMTVTILKEANLPPAVEGDFYSTLESTAVYGAVAASDPEGDAVEIQVRAQPKKGSVSFEGNRFVYRPYQGAHGTDSFRVIAMDRFGNYSQEAVISIAIEKNKDNFYFSDMSGNPSQYAASKLHQNGVMSGEKVGGHWYFYPGRQVNRGELLVMVMAASGRSAQLPATVNTGLPGDAALPLWLKPYVKKALDEGILNKGEAFRPYEIPTRAEAVAMTSLAAGISDVKDFALTMGDVAKIPNWALPHYKNLAAYKMLDLHDGLAEPGKAVDRAYAADLVWQLYKGCQSK